MQIFSGGTDGYSPGRSRAKKQDESSRADTKRNGVKYAVSFCPVWAIWSMTPPLFYTASEALVCLKIAFWHRNISIPPQIFVGRLPAFLHEFHPQTNGVPGQRRAAGFCRLFQNIFPSRTKAWRFPFSRNLCGKYGYKISRAWGSTETHHFPTAR